MRMIDSDEVSKKGLRETGLLHLEHHELLQVLTVAARQMGEKNSRNTFSSENVRLMFSSENSFRTRLTAD